MPSSSYYKTPLPVPHIRQKYVLPTFKLVLFFTLILPIFMDQFNGFIQQVLHYNFSIAQIYKSSLLFFFLIYIIAYSLRDTILVFSFFFILSLTLMNITRTSTLTFPTLFSELSQFGRLLIFPFTYTFFKIYLTQQPYSVEKINQVFYTIFLFLFYIIGIAILLSLFNLGLPTYKVGAGYKGYFYSPNQLSGLYLLVFSIIAYHSIKNWSYKRSLIHLLTGALIAFLLGTKTVIIGYFLIIITILFFIHQYYHRFVSFTKLLKKYHLLFISIAVVIILVISQFYFLIEPLVNKWIYSFQHHPSVFSFITSGRILRLEHYWHLFYEQADISTQLLGYGHTYYNQINLAAINWGGIEMDPLDIVGKYGLIGGSFIYSFWLYLLLFTFMSFYVMKNKYIPPVFLAFLLLFLNSLIAGHIINSSMVGLYLGFALAFVNHIKSPAS